MKKDRIKPTLKFFITFIILIFCTTSITLFILNIFIVPTYIQENNLIHSECKESVLKEIEQIAFNVSSSHEYVRGKYDCKQFSSELVKQLKSQNISAYCVYGLYNKTASHVWVRTIIENQTYDIEATSGFIIDNETYSKNYKELKKGFCFKK
jgi:hypothetical protein